MVSELCNQLIEEMESVRLILTVNISLTDDPDDAAHHLGLGQNVEECLVLTEIAEGLGSIKSLVQVLVLER